MIEEITYVYDNFIRTLYTVIPWIIVFGLFFVLKMIKGNKNAN